MFTGIVAGTGRLLARQARGGDARVDIEAEVLETNALAPGASVAVNGCCLTVVETLGRGFRADLSSETLARTALGEAVVGGGLNLEAALVVGGALGGHFVSGHVDGVGTLVASHEDGCTRRMRFRAPPALARFIAAKGSIAVDGVSLTVNEVAGAEFEVAVIPATLERTIVGAYAPGVRVNLEVDLIARYLARLFEAKAE